MSNHITIRLDNELYDALNQVAKTRGLPRTTIVKMYLLKGMEAETQHNLKYSLEALCILRRLAGSVDIDILRNGQSDAEHLLEKISPSALMEKTS